VWFTAAAFISPALLARFGRSVPVLIVATAVVRDGQVSGGRRSQMGPFLPRRVLASASESINETLAEMQLT
jgi:hypothetical protein